jgi:hypothetical protein
VNDLYLETTPDQAARALRRAVLVLGILALLGLASALSYLYLRRQAATAHTTESLGRPRASHPVFHLDISAAPRPATPLAPPSPRATFSGCPPAVVPCSRSDV